MVVSDCTLFFPGEAQPASDLPVTSSKVWWRTSPEQARAATKTFYEALNYVFVKCWRLKHRESIAADFIGDAAKIVAVTHGRCVKVAGCGRPADSWSPKMGWQLDRACRALVNSLVSASIDRGVFAV
jgi:hypothetical protein